MKDDNIHKHHRKRMRAIYEKNGGDVFELHQLVEMLLFHSLRQGDTNPAAHRLLNACPRLAFGVTSSDELTGVEGIGNNTANLLRISSDTVTRLLMEDLKSCPMESEFSRMTYCWLWFKNKTPETVAAFLFDDKMRYADAVILAQGKTRAPADYKDMLLLAMKQRGAAFCMIGHNHPDNVAKASLEDIYLTGYLKNALEESGYRLLGHYIVTDTDCVECPR